MTRIRVAIAAMAGICALAVVGVGMAAPAPGRVPAPSDGAYPAVHPEIAQRQARHGR